MKRHRHKYLIVVIYMLYISTYDELSKLISKVIISMEPLLSITKAVSDGTRVRALLALRGGELCVCQIIEVLGLVPSTVSKQMSILRQAKLVKGEKRGKWMYYALNFDEKPVSTILNWLIENGKNDPIVLKDKDLIKTLSCSTIAKRK